MEDQDFVVGIESRQAAGRVQRVQQIVLVGGQIDHVSRPTFRVPLFTAPLFSDDKNLMHTLTHQGDDDGVLTHGQDLPINRVGLANDLRGLRKGQAGDLNGADERQADGAIFPNRNGVSHCR